MWGGKEGEREEGVGGRDDGKYSQGVNFSPVSSGRSNYCASVIFNLFLGFL